MWLKNQTLALRPSNFVIILIITGWIGLHLVLLPLWSHCNVDHWVIKGQILFYSVLLPWIRDYRLINPIFEGFHIYFFRQVKYVLWIMLRKQIFKTFEIFEGFHIYFFRQVKYVLWIMLRKQIFKTFEVNLSWFLLLLLFFFSWQYH